MGKNTYCKNTFEVGDTAYYYSSQTQLTTDGQTYKYYQDIVYTITSDTEKLCMYLLEDNRTPSGYRIYSYFSNYVVGEYHFIKNGEYMYPMGSIPICSDSVLPNCYSIPDSLGRYVISESTFNTNIPIFASEEDAQLFIDGDLDISHAINYNKVFKNDAWTEYVEEPSKCEALLMEKHLLMARRRLLMEMRNKIYCNSAFKVGDTAIFSCSWDEKRGTNIWHNNYYSSFVVTEENKYVCIFIRTDLSAFPNGKLWHLNEANFKKVNVDNLLSTNQTWKQYINDETDNIKIVTSYSWNSVAPPPYYESTFYNGVGSLYTNIPIFNDENDAKAYASGELDITKAINYNKVIVNNEWVQV